MRRESGKGAVREGGVEPTAEARKAPPAERWTLRPRPADEAERAGVGVRRRSASVGTSLAIHLVGAAVFVRLITLPLPFQTLVPRERASEEPAERITFIATPEAGPTTTPGRSGGDGLPERPDRRPAPPLVAPAEVPTALPPAPATPPVAPPPEGGSGEIIGEGGPTRGVRPTLSDKRIWLPQPAEEAGARALAKPKTEAQRLDSVITSTLAEHADSMRLHSPEPTKFERGDWTVEKNGQKWGIDQKFIRLGKFSIPTALLGLLPLNVQSNPIAAERERAMAMMRRDILEHATHATNEAEFRKTVRAIRERKERERREAEKQRAQPVIAPDERERPRSPSQPR